MITDVADCELGFTPHVRFAPIRLILFLVVCGSVLLVGLSKAEDRQPSIDEQAGNLSKADSPAEFARRCSKLFRNAKNDDLRQLVGHSDAGVALAAGWERVRRTVSEELPANGDVVPDAEALNRFLGLVEGRTQAPLPAFWEKAVRSAGSRGRQNIRFPLVAKLLSQRTELPNPANLPDPPPPNFKQEGNRWIVQAEGREWVLPELAGGADRLAIGMNEKMVFFLLYSWSPSPHALYGVDRASGEVKWSNKVWDETGSVWHISGSQPVEAELRLRDEEVVVFGISEYAFIGSFDVNSGKALYRFSTAFFDENEWR